MICNGSIRRNNLNSFSSCWRWHRGKHLFLEANWKTKGWTFLLFCCCLYTYSLWQNMEFCLDLNWKIILILMLLQFATIEFARFFFMKCCRSEKKCCGSQTFIRMVGIETDHQLFFVIPPHNASTILPNGNSGAKRAKNFPEYFTP